MKSWAHLEICESSRARNFVKGTMRQKHPPTQPWGRSPPGRLVGCCNAWGDSSHLICLQKASSSLPVGVWSSAPWLNIIRLGVLHDLYVPGVWVGERSPGPAGVVGFYGQWQPNPPQHSTAHPSEATAGTHQSFISSHWFKWNPLFVANHSIQGWKVHRTKNKPS